MSRVLKREVDVKEDNNKLYNVKVAALPYIATIEEYDISFQPSLNENKIRNIDNSDFYVNRVNLCFIVNPGTGKTHLSIAIGHAVAVKKTAYIS